MDSGWVFHYRGGRKIHAPSGGKFRIDHDFCQEINGSRLFKLLKTICFRDSSVINTIMMCMYNWSAFYENFYHEFVWNAIFLGSLRTWIQWLYEFETLKALIKLSRKMAIFEFSSSNGFSSFTLNFECREIRITEIGDENQNHFSYLVLLSYDLHSYTCCEERGYEERWTDPNYCITSFQG